MEDEVVEPRALHLGHGEVVEDVVAGLGVQVEAHPGLHAPRAPPSLTDICPKKYIILLFLAFR